ncbi:hypothetical protein HG264_07465 [Pseudomonas sp. gcc21]|uniref:poly(ethylene terephthalate) hydrolase family protein n=1 Tax=Pseudomonas sp. gcc21 TaxID=2726989 RepID=UPI0014524B20|nr:hypothetical protein [Pseudomonas sp. gcc21]QJD58756.1 hypothetical protein HG264_07465 [Pseudomonas sp. gcc21]
MSVGIAMKKALIMGLCIGLLPLHAAAFNPPTNPPTDPTDPTDPPPSTGTPLPPVSSVERDGPYQVTIDKNTGPSRQGWVARPATLGENGVQHPIFIWGPGAGSTPSSYEDHLRRIASHGFVVYSEVSSSSGDEMTDAMDWLIEQNDSTRSPYHEKLDTGRIAAGGHSRGSVGTFAIGDDPRLTTTIHVAGGSFDGRGSSNLRKPAAYICGEDDTLATPNCERDYAATRVPVWFTVIDDSSHTSAARDGLPMIVAWLRWHLAGETERRSMFVDPSCEFCGPGYETEYKNW